jgi:hypothetical protein
LRTATVSAPSLVSSTRSVLPISVR